MQIRASRNVSGVAVGWAKIALPSRRILPNLTGDFAHAVNWNARRALLPHGSSAAVARVERKRNPGAAFAVLISQPRISLRSIRATVATHYSSTGTQRRPERPIEGPYHCAPGHRDPRDQQEELRLRHRRPEAAEIAGAEVADEAGGEPHAHHHGQIPYRRNLGDERQSDRRQVQFGGGGADEER